MDVPVDASAHTSTALAVLERIMPGVARVRAQVAPFAAAWHQANEQALRDTGPMWIALGDSMSQGIGAHDVDTARIGNRCE